jgi:hypothetical protein
MNQREAVYTATKSVLKDAGIAFEDGNNINSVMTDDFRKRIHAIVVSAFTEGTVEFKATPSNDAKLENPSELSSYVSGLISNWFRKDKRFNGNTTYSAKNPGSRAGQGDPQLKALRQLAKQFAGVDAEKAAEINAHIEARIKAVGAAKAKKVDIDLTQIPADLKETLGL